MLAAFCPAQNGSEAADDPHAGYTPVISGGAGYIHNVNAGVTTLEPQINPILLIPLGQRVLLESRADFTGVFQRKNLTYGSYEGKVYQTIEFAQINWIATKHITTVTGRYLLPFGLFNERLQPVWIRNLQDTPITEAIGTRISDAGNGFMLRGSAVQHPNYSIQYTTYFSVRSNISKLESARTAGFDSSIYLTPHHVEAGVSYQRFLQQKQINSAATYISWQPIHSLDIKAEGDFSHYGRGYWIESAYHLQQLPLPAIARHIQVVGRVQQFYPIHGGGNALPVVDALRFDMGLNYYLCDNLRFVSSFGRSFSSAQNTNIWNIGFTYRFLYSLLPERKK